MSERPIIFSASMVRALLADTKTQTRRVLSRATSETSSPWDRLDFAGRTRFLHAFPDGQVTQYLHVPLAPHANDPQDDPDHWAMARVFPRIRAGDLLWVRESFANIAIKGYDPVYFYRADSDELPPHDARAADNRWRPSIHMPRAAARIQLRVKAVRVERLHEISADDCIAEGIARPSLDDAGELGLFVRLKFRELWDRINGARAPWASNPFCWAISFERV